MVFPDAFLRVDTAVSPPWRLVEHLVSPPLFLLLGEGERGHVRALDDFVRNFDDFGEFRPRFSPSGLCGLRRCEGAAGLSASDRPAARVGAGLPGVQKVFNRF